MIVEPDFLTHWKTQLLVNELNDKCAPLYVIALWIHCQQRRTDTFSNMAPNALKAICRYEGEASRLRSALERCGFIKVNGEAVAVHGWSETNAKLVANWTNGQSGGRPRKPNENPTPDSVIGGLSDKSGLDGIEKKEKRKATPSKFVPPTLEEVRAFFAEKGTVIDPEQFFAHYDANGWKQANGNPLKKWKSALVTWEKNHKERKGTSHGKPRITSGPGQRFTGGALGSF